MPPSLDLVARSRLARSAFKWTRGSRTPRFYAQKGQDFWIVHEVFDGRRGGYFVDAGAFDGIWCSNTYVLERALDWNGICIEANPEACALLQENRSSCCVHACLDDHPGSVMFAVDGELGGIVAGDTDNRPRARSRRLRELEERGRILEMDAVRLAQVLDRCGAPQVIDYLSIDIEGAETRVLRNFPFDRYTFLAVTIERPSPELNRILMEENGYRFVRNVRFDTFYVHESFERMDRISFDPFEQVPPKDW